MKITVHFPQIMKMEMQSKFSNAETLSFPLLQQRIFEDFWNQWKKYFPERTEKHGIARNVTVLACGAPISDDETWQKLLDVSKDNLDLYVKFRHP